MCIEIQTNRPLPKIIRVDGLEHELVYEELCFQCERIGHFKPQYKKVCLVDRMEKRRVVEAIYRTDEVDEDDRKREPVLSH